MRTLLVTALLLAGCFSPPRRELRELAHVRPPVTAPANRTLYLFAPDGAQLAADDAATFVDGWVFVPAAGDAGSFWLGTWYEYRAAERVAGPSGELPEPIERRWRAEQARSL